MRYLIYFFLGAYSLLASEPSAFGAGDLNNPNPYGLTHEEKLIQENNKKIDNIAHKNNVQSAKVESVTERLDGFQAIIEGLTQSSNEQKLLLGKLSESAGEGNESEALSLLGKKNSENSDNLLQLKGLVEELSRSVDAINASYVTKEEFSALVKQLKVSLPTIAKASNDLPKKNDNNSIEKEAKRLFDHQKYSESYEYYGLMVQKKYKSAEANFWMGECEFAQKKFKEAIGHYKLSASLNEKSSVMPTLLLHTGISMEKIGDVEKAKSFYNVAISRFPASGAANEAKQKLAKLK